MVPMTYAKEIATQVATIIARNGWDFSEENVRKVATTETRLTPWLTEDVVRVVLSTIYV